MWPRRHYGSRQLGCFNSRLVNYEELTGLVQRAILSLALKQKLTGTVAP